MVRLCVCVCVCSSTPSPPPSTIYLNHHLLNTDYGPGFVPILSRFVFWKKNQVYIFLNCVVINTFSIILILVKITTKLLFFPSYKFQDRNQEKGEGLLQKVGWIFIKPNIQVYQITICGENPVPYCFTICRYVGKKALGLNFYLQLDGWQAQEHRR